MAWSFRWWGNLASRLRIECESPSLLLSREGTDPTVRLSSGNPDVQLSKTTSLILRGDGYPSKEVAYEQALEFRDMMVRCFARLRIAVDLGARAPKGRLYDIYFRSIMKETGQRGLNDVHGLMVFETYPEPFFASIEGAGARLVKSEKIVGGIGAALKVHERMGDQELLAYDLFSASFFNVTADTRLILLMMAVEALLELKERDKSTLEHVEELITLTKKSNTLSEDEKTSLLGQLGQLKRQSISQAGRDLARSLSGRAYAGMAPEELFTMCYGIRSKLVHGEYPQPSLEEVGRAAAHLELFVSDLLSGPLREMEF